MHEYIFNKKKNRMLQLQGLTNDDIIFLQLITKTMIKELQQMLTSLSITKSNSANLNEYRSKEKLLLDIINLDQVKERILIVIYPIEYQLCITNFNIYFVKKLFTPHWLFLNNINTKK